MSWSIHYLFTFSYCSSIIFPYLRLSVFSTTTFLHYFICKYLDWSALEITHMSLGADFFLAAAEILISEFRTRHWYSNEIGKNVYMILSLIGTWIKPKSSLWHLSWSRILSMSGCPCFEKIDKDLVWSYNNGSIL